MKVVLDQSVVISGIIKMLQLSASNWDSQTTVSLIPTFMTTTHESHLESVPQYDIIRCLFLGAIPLSSGVFGDDLESTTLHSVECSGNETEIQNCSYSTTGTCTEHSAAVICQGTEGMKNNDIVILFCWSHTDPTTKPSNCNDGDLRLTGAVTTNQGRLEVCMNGAWGSVCDSQGLFTTDEAKVACRQLGKLQVEG